MQTAFDSWLATAFPASPPKKVSKKARLLQPLQRRPVSESNQTQNQTPTQNQQPRKRSSLPALDAPSDTKQLARFHSLVAECSYHGVEYPDKTFSPRLAFFGALASARHTDIGVQLPCTFVCDGAGGFTLLYTATTASVLQVKVYATKLAVMKDAQKIVNLLTRASPSSNNAAPGALACHKVQQSHGNDTQFLRTKLDVLQQLDSIASNPTTVAALQEFIQPKGPKAWLVRSVWQAKHPFVWVLTDHGHNFTDTSSMASCNIDKSTTSSSWPVPKALTANLVHVLEPVLAVKFQLVVVDLIQNDDGQWWLTQVKAFRCKRIPVPGQVETNQDEPRARTTCAERRCKRPPNPSLSMLYKEFLHCQFDHSAHDDPIAAWDKHLASLHRKDRNRLYNRVLLCDSCYSDYSAKKALRPLTGATQVAKKPNIQRPLPANTDDLLCAFEAALVVDDDTPSPELDQLSAPELSPRHPELDSSHDRADQESESMVSIAARGHQDDEQPAIEDEVPFRSMPTPPTPTLEPPLTEPPAVDKTTAPAASRPASSHLDTLWSTLAPAPLAPSSGPAEPAAPGSIVVLPRETIELDASRFFFDEDYKRDVLVSIRTHFLAMHSVQVVACTQGSDGSDALALQTLFLDVQDECIEGQYGLFHDAVATKSLTLTPYYSVPRTLSHLLT